MLTENQIRSRSVAVTIGLLPLLLLGSCDCVRSAEGVVLDKSTLEPIPGVSIGKHEKDDANNSNSRRAYSDDRGTFEYSDISGGLGGCPGLKLYFEKPGYRTRKMTFPSFSLNDTVYLEKFQTQ